MANSKHALTPAMREALAKIVDSGGAYVLTQYGDELVRRKLATQTGGRTRAVGNVFYEPTTAGRRMRKTLREKSD